MKPTFKTIFVTDDTEEFDRQITDLLRQGYRLHGSPRSHVIHPPRHTDAQSLVSLTQHLYHTGNEN